ncbi:hypothetical protein MLD38_029237 [Melastoma candidum]|uniref:Uncharacterized protein n=1 Tax=Melastoma candidum TaxID=119954 RepID=A0ACB9N496_9MYRT|nr:hypothetical protein MLD38_029237 [Melastoma candidum]
MHLRCQMEVSSICDSGQSQSGEIGQGKDRARMDPFNRQEIDCYGFPPMHCLFTGLLFSFLCLFRLAGGVRLATVNSPTRLRGPVAKSPRMNGQLGYPTGFLTEQVLHLLPETFAAF